MRNQLFHTTSNKPHGSVMLGGVCKAYNFSYASPYVLGHFVLGRLRPFCLGPLPILFSLLLSVICSPDYLFCILALFAGSRMFSVNHPFDFLKLFQPFYLKARKASFLCKEFGCACFYFSCYSSAFKNTIHKAFAYSKLFGNVFRRIHILVKLDYAAFFFITCFVVCGSCHAQEVREISKLSQAQIAGLSHAIFLSEGGDKARVPYGVLSVKVSGKEEARRVTERSIVNNYARWEKAGKPGDFFQFMGSRWCPPSADPIGHRNWVLNVRKIYNGKEIR